jgi:hypothetical protein
VSESNPDLVYIGMGESCICGNIMAGDGVYKTTDGGKTWRKVLYRDDKTGAIDISVDRTNPNVLYAALWEWNPSYGSDVMESHILLLRDKAEKELGEEEGDDEPRAGSSAFRLQASSGPGREPDRAASRSPRGWPRT